MGKSGVQGPKISLVRIYQVHVEGNHQKTKSLDFLLKHLLKKESNFKVVKRRPLGEISRGAITRVQDCNIFLASGGNIFLVPFK